MKKLISVFCVLVCSASLLFAVDAGGTLVGGAAFSANTPTSIGISPSFTFTGWLRQPLSNLGTFAVEGNYSYSADSTVLDLALLKATLNFGPVKLEAGRFSVADATGTIYNMTADGAYVTYGSRFFTANAYGAYTGFLNSSKVAVSGLKSSYVSPSVPYTIAGTPNFGVGMIRLSLPSLLKGQTFGVDGLACLNLDGKETDRMWATAFMNGPVVRMVYYGLSGSVSLVDDITGVLAKGNLVWYPGVLSSSLSGSVTYADKNFSQFAEGGPSQDGSLKWNNTIDVQLGASCKPIPLALVSLTTDIVAAGNETNDMKLHSYQWKLAGNIQVVSDFALTVSVGEIIPLSKSTSPYLNGSVGATLAF